MELVKSKGMVVFFVIFITLSLVCSISNKRYDNANISDSNIIESK